MTIKWDKFDKQVVQDKHGEIYFYRNLYKGRHGSLFKRASELIEKGEITDQIMYGRETAKNVKTPYIVANICKLIVNVPATFVARSIGKVTTSLKPTPEEPGIEEENIAQAAAPNESTDKLIAGPEEGLAFNTEILNKQQELIEQIAENSQLASKHFGNIVMQQVDGGIVGIPRLDENDIRIEFKARDVYFPHDDGKGLDLTLKVTIEGAEYLHVWRERLEGGTLTLEHLLYHLNATQHTELVEEEEAKRLLKMNSLKTAFPGRTTHFVEYFGNDVTFIDPLGVSVLEGQDKAQDEINWSLTRYGITFERNGKPRMSVTPGIMDALKEAAQERYGDESMIDHRDLEITEMDENGESIRTTQIDITKIGDVQWVKDLMKMMLMETQTSERAIDFYAEGSNAQTGVAKYYDLLTSLMKAERIQAEYIGFLKRLFKSTLWLQNRQDPSILIEEPEVQLNSMLPVTEKELTETNNANYEAGTQSLETTVRRNNPHASEEWIQDELERLESSKGADSLQIVSGATQAADYLQNRRAQRGEPTEGGTAGGTAATGTTEEVLP